MRIKQETVVIECDSCHKKSLEEEAGKWYQLVQARTNGTVDSLARLDFCQESCVEAFMDLEIQVRYRDKTKLLDRAEAELLGLMEFVHIFLRD